MRTATRLAAATLAATLGTAAAASTGMDQCTAVTNIANDAINARQDHVPEAEYREHLRQRYDVEPREMPLVEGIITAAYGEPVFQVPQDRRHVIRTFIERWRQACEAEMQE